MSAPPLTGNARHKPEMEYNGKFGNTIGSIEQIDLMGRIEICYATCHIATQTVAPTIPGFQGIKCCIQYLGIHPHKTIYYPSNDLNGSNSIRHTWNVNQVEDYTTQFVLE